MFKSVLNIPKYLDLNKIGFLELAFAFTPLLSGYSLRSLPMSVLMWVFLIFISLFHRGKRKRFDFIPLALFVLYWAIHDIAMIFIDDKNTNVIIANAIFFASIFFLYPVMDLQKVRGSLNLVSLISIIGLLYQWSIIVRGGQVHPIEIPGFTMSEHRMESFTSRPSSFFMEPAAYVSFMICPLALSLIDRKYPWSIVLILSMFLTTSTTGLLLSFLMLGISLLSQRRSMKSAIILIISGIGLFLALTHFDAFNTGVVKFENTDTETNIRLSQGPYVVSTMKATEFVFGAPYSSAYNYCSSGRATNVVFYGENVFMATFWDMILCYGIVGLLLYMNIYWHLYKRNSIALPFIICAVATWFSGGYGIQGLFAFSTIFLLIITKRTNHYSLPRR